jgi:hypothetical protein
MQDMQDTTGYLLACALGAILDLVGVISFLSALSEEDASSSLERKPVDMVYVAVFCDQCEVSATRF